jgi:hypothetical protein
LRIYFLFQIGTQILRDNIRISRPNRVGYPAYWIPIEERGQSVTDWNTLTERDLYMIIRQIEVGMRLIQGIKYDENGRIYGITLAAISPGIESDTIVSDPDDLRIEDITEYEVKN